MAGDEDESDHGAVANHEEVLDAVQKRANQIQQLVKNTVAIIDRDVLPTLPDLSIVSLDIPDRVGDFNSKERHSESYVSLGTHIALGAALVAAGAFIGAAVGSSRRK